MSVHLLIVHSGQRIVVDRAAIASLDALKARLLQDLDLPANKQIILTSHGRQAKPQSLDAEDELFIYSRDVFSARSKDSTSLAVTVPDHNVASHAHPPAPDALASQDDLLAWQDLFKARREWALELTDKARRLSKLGAAHLDASSVIERGLGVAVGNLEGHVRALEQRHNEAQDWVAGLCSAQQANLTLLDTTSRHLKELPGDARFQRLVPHLLSNHGQPSRVPDPHRGCLDTFVQQETVESARSLVRNAVHLLSEQATRLVSQVEHLFQVAGDLFEDIEQTHAQTMPGLEHDAGHLQEQIEVVASKVVADHEHAARLTAGQKSVSQASKMALLHTREHLPSLSDSYSALNHLIQRIVTKRNAAALRVVSSMQRVVEVEGLLANADAQVKSLDLPISDHNALGLINAIVQLPCIYGALLLEAIRRHEWAKKIRADASTLAEDMASFREEEDKRRRRWHKTIGDMVEEPASTNVLDFELNILPDQGSWPEIERGQALDYITVLKRLPGQEEAAEKLEAEFQDLDKPTKRQLKAGKHFRSGSFHDAHAGTASFFLRRDDELRLLREANQKLDDQLKGQKSRVRKLEDLLYRQTQAGRTPFSHSFQLVDGAAQHLPSPEPFLPPGDFGEQMSQQASATLRRPSEAGTAEEKRLAKRIVSLEADLHQQKQINDDLKSAAPGRSAGGARLRSQLADAESTKKDLMDNLDAIQREFTDERRLLEEEINRQKARNEEVEEELDRIIGSRETEIGVEAKLRSLESELEQTKAAVAARDRDLKQYEEAQTKERVTLGNACRTLGTLEVDASLPSADLVRKIEEAAERVSRQLKDLSDVIVTTRAEKEELQVLMDRRGQESSSAQKLVQSLEEATTRLRNECNAEQAMVGSLIAELGDARQQLKSLQAKFAEGETGSGVLQQRLTEQADRASMLATELAQAKSHVNSLDVELSSLQRRHNTLMASADRDKATLEQRSLKARELTNRLVTCYYELVRLVTALGLLVSDRDGTLTIQRPSKNANSSSSFAGAKSSVTSSLLSPPVSNFDSSIDAMLLSWMHCASPADEDQRFTELLTKLDRFSLNTFSEAVIKLRRDVEWTGKKWKMEARSYRDKYHRAQAEAHEKLAFRSFKDGDLALFLPTRNQATKPWAAFNVGAPHFFLREQDTHKLKGREWLVARISRIEERVVDLSKTMNSSLEGDRGSVGDKTSESILSMEHDNPFELSDGLRWYLLDAAEEKFVAPSTPSFGKSTVASATHHAKGRTIGLKSQSAGGNDASAKLHSLESRRSSSNSKRGSISAGSTHQRDIGEETSIVGARSPTLAEKATDGLGAKPTSLHERSASRASLNNVPCRSSGLGVEITKASQPPDRPSNDEVRRDQLWGA